MSMSEPEARYEMANLTPRMTGLRHRGRDRHDVRVKVQQSHRRRMSPSNTGSVAVWPTPWEGRRLVSSHGAGADPVL